MADVLMDGGFSGYPDAWDFVISQSVHSTPPVGQAEVGITPDLDDPLAFPPLYQGSPVVAANLTLAEIGDSGLVFSTSAPRPPGVPQIAPGVGLTGLNGFICPLFDDDLYGRIILNPILLAFGNVLQQQSRTVELWNAFFVPKTLNVINETGTFGLNLIRPAGAPTEPAVYQALQSRIYTVQAEEVGPAVINAQYDFDFAPDFSPTLTVTGARVIAFPYCFEKPFRETLEFKTDVMKTEIGNEQRVSSRKIPRQLFRMQYLLTDENERQRALNAIFGHQGRIFAVPLFQWHRPLLVDAAITDTTIFVDTANADFRESTIDKQRLIILWRSPTDFEIAQVAVGGLATPGQIDLELPLDQAHTAGTDVVPLTFSLSKDPFQYEETQNNIITLDAQWLSNDFEDLSDLSSLPTLDGIPILADPNLIDTTLAQGFNADYDLFDTVGGPFQAFRNRTVPETQTFRGFEVAGDAAAWTLRQILYGLKGRQKSFWMPTFRNDFTVVVPIGAADLNITFEENDFHRFAEDGPDPWGGFYLELVDGTQFFREIVGTTAPSGGQESITLGASLGQAVTLAEIRISGLLVRSRFDQDRIAIEWPRTGNIKSRIPVVGVKES